MVIENRTGYRATVDLYVNGVQTDEGLVLSSEDGAVPIWLCSPLLPNAFTVRVEVAGPGGPEALEESRRFTCSHGCITMQILQDDNGRFTLSFQED